MKILVAKKTNRAWDQVGTLYPRKNGTCDFPKRMLGMPSCFFAKQAIRTFLADPAIAELDYQFGNAYYRITLI
ncbi:MAG: hypothetical protein U9R60_12055 [Bacteroidota bacterium]|nr:hypothetical protein [Bacteroidota bacterium]